MPKQLLDKLWQSTRSVLPIFATVCLLHALLVPLPAWTFASFLVGSLLLMLGMALFTTGADMAIEPMGETIGAELTKTRSLPIIVLFGFLLGVVVTIAEPDLQVLARQVPSVPDLVLMLAVAGGVGLFLVLALLRILFQISFSLLLWISYAAVFLLAALATPNFLAVGFDAGGVTTGPITVPFILALGAGISGVRGSRSAEQDSFGMCALCSIGPVLAVMLLELFFDAGATGYAYTPPGAVASAGGLARAYARQLAASLAEVALVLLPVVAIFGMLQLVRRRLPRGQLVRIGVGVLYTLAGLTIFLSGIQLGFLPAGTVLGKSLALSPYRGALVPLGAVLGFFVVYAEPAVHVLNRQVEEMTGGAIPQGTMMTGIALGVGAALALSILRILNHISIWYFLLPGYAAALVLTFFTPRIFSAVAFDSGGVSAGTMTAAFLLPFSVGICEAAGGNVITEAFGVIAMVAMLPLISMQLLGVAYRIRLSRARAQAGDAVPDDEVLDAIAESGLDIDAFVAEYGAIPERGAWDGPPVRGADEQKATPPEAVTTEPERLTLSEAPPPDAPTIPADTAAADTALPEPFPAAARVDGVDPPAAEPAADTDSAAPEHDEQPEPEQQAAAATMEPAAMPEKPCGANTRFDQKEEASP